VAFVVVTVLHRLSQFAQNVLYGTAILLLCFSCEDVGATTSGWAEASAALWAVAVVAIRWKFARYKSALKRKASATGGSASSPYPPSSDLDAALEWFDEVSCRMELLPFICVAAEAWRASAGWG